VVHPSNGLQLQVLTTSPGVQFYTGGFLGGDLPDGKDGACYPRFGGFCLETQNFPDAVNQANFPEVVLTPDKEYRHEMVYRFSAS
jgi:aldose 1-epimerase